MVQGPQRPQPPRLYAPNFAAPAFPVFDVQSPEVIEAP